MKSSNLPESDSGNLSDDSDKRGVAQIVLSGGTELLIMSANIVGAGEAVEK